MNGKLRITRPASLMVIRHIDLKLDLERISSQPSGDFKYALLLMTTTSDVRSRDARTMSVKGAIVRRIPLELRAEVFAHLEDLEPNIRAMVIDAIGALRLVEGGPLLVDRLQREQDRHLRPAILDALVAINHPERHAVLRQLAVTVDDSVRGAAIVLLGRLGDAADFPLMLHLLQDDDEDIARKARIAFSYLPLTPQQQSQVDAIWDATEDDSESHSPGRDGGAIKNEQ
jgi:hypothetical protein